MESALSDHYDFKDWQFLTGDCNWQDYGATWAKRTLDGKWWLIRFSDKREWGDGARGYHCEVLHIDLQEARNSIADALASCGWHFDVETADIINDYDGDVVAEFAGEVVEGEPIRDGDNSQWELVIVMALEGYGTYSPMDEESADVELDEYDDYVDGDRIAEELREAMRVRAEEMIEDAHATTAALARPVNALGATAADFGRGDPLAPLREKAGAILRGDNVELSTRDSIMLRMYGACHGRTLGGKTEAQLAAAGRKVSADG
jgi:hypothetical protein